MQRNECKPGTEVIIRGKIKEDDGTDLHPIIVDIHGSKREEIRCLDPSQLERAQPYEVKEKAFSFQVTRGDYYMHTIWWNSDACLTSPYSKEEAQQKAQELCDELNRKHQESLNA